MISCVIDTNVILDALLAREPFLENARAIFSMELNDRVNATITSNTVTDIYYLSHKVVSDDTVVRKTLDALFHVFPIAEVSNADCVDALESPMADYEDAVLALCARRHSAAVIVTRNVSDFANSPVEALTPAEFIARVSNASDESAR